MFDKDVVNAFTQHNESHRGAEVVLEHLELLQILIVTVRVLVVADLVNTELHQSADVQLLHVLLLRVVYSKQVNYVLLLSFPYCPEDVLVEGQHRFHLPLELVAQ